MTVFTTVIHRRNNSGHIMHVTYKVCGMHLSQPCHDQIYSNVEMIRRMNKNIRELRVTSELLPRCNECGRIMVPWVRDDTFLEGKDWREGVRRYENFLKKYLMNGTDKNVVLLELGVGEMTPSIIKLPFWEMTYKNEKVFYACLNQKKSSVPVSYTHLTLPTSDLV